MLLEVEMLQTNDRSFVKVAYSRSRQPPKDLSNPDAIVDWLDERNMIGIEFRKVKEMMNDATKIELKLKTRRDNDDDSDI